MPFVNRLALLVPLLTGTASADAPQLAAAPVLADDSGPTGSDPRATVTGVHAGEACGE